MQFDLAVLFCFPVYSQTKFYFALHRCTFYDWCLTDYIYIHALKALRRPPMQGCARENTHVYQGHMHRHYQARQC